MFRHKGTHLLREEMAEGTRRTEAVKLALVASAPSRRAVSTGKVDKRRLVRANVIDIEKSLDEGAPVVEVIKVRLRGLAYAKAMLKLLPKRHCSWRHRRVHDASNRGILKESCRLGQDFLGGSNPNDRIGLDGECIATQLPRRSALDH